MEYPARYNLPPLIEPLLIGVGAVQTREMYAKTFDDWLGALTPEQTESYNGYMANMFVQELHSRSDLPDFAEFKDWLIAALNNYVDES